MDKKEIRNLLLKLFGQPYFQSKCTAVLYGSQKKGRDIDILLIQEGRTPTPHLLAGQMDFFIVSKSDFKALLKLLDPIVVEPALTGQILFGDTDKWKRLKKRVSNTKPKPACSEHALLKSLEETLSTNRIWRQYQSERDPILLEWTFQNLSFAISYLSFAKYYSQLNSSPCTLSKLINKGKVLLPDFWLYRSSVKNGSSELNSTYLEHWISLWLNFFLEPCN